MKGTDKNTQIKLFIKIIILEVINDIRKTDAWFMSNKLFGMKLILTSGQAMPFRGGVIRRAI